MNHPTEDMLDEYALGRITDEGQLAAIEEHLLICEECPREVELVDAIKGALTAGAGARYGK